MELILGLQQAELLRRQTKADEAAELVGEEGGEVGAKDAARPDQEDGDRPNAAAPAAAADADGPMAARTSASEAPPLLAEQPVPAAIVPAPKEKRASGAAKAAEGCSMGCGSEPITDSPSDIGRRGLLSDRPRRTPPATPKDENTSASDRITGRGGTNVREWRGPSGASNRPPVEPIAELARRCCCTEASKRPRAHELRAHLPAVRAGPSADDVLGDVTA